MWSWEKKPHWVCTCEPVSPAIAKRKGIRAISSGYTGTHSHLWGVTNVLSANYRLKSDKRKIRGKKDSCAVCRTTRVGTGGNREEEEEDRKVKWRSRWGSVWKKNIISVFFSTLFPLVHHTAWFVVSSQAQISLDVLYFTWTYSHARFTYNRRAVIRVVQALNISHIFGYTISIVGQDYEPIKYNVCFP